MNLTRSVLFERDDQNRIKAIWDPNSGLTNNNQLSTIDYQQFPPAVRYLYHKDTGNLLQVHKLVDRSGGTYLTNHYRYEHPKFPHYITKIEDARGIPVVRNLYDDSGRLVGIIDTAGHTNAVSHDLGNHQEIQYDRSGQPTIYQYDTLGNVTNVIDALGHPTSFQYDTNGYLTASSDALGNTTYYTNDTKGNVLSITLPHPPDADPALYRTEFTWDDYGNQTSVKLSTGGIITNHFDSLGRLTEIRDGSSNLISKTEYDPVTGLVTAEIDHFGANTFGYDDQGNAIRFTNSLNQVIYSGFDPNGNLTAMTNKGVPSSFQFDGQGRETTSDFGNGITLTNNYQSQSDWTSVDAPTVGHMERRFDEQGRLAGWTTVNQATPGFAYDVNGRLEYETNSIGVVSQSTYDWVGRLLAVTNLATGAGTRYDYDDAGRRTAESNPLGQVTRFVYWPSGSLKAVTNAFGTNYWLYSDAAGACSGCGNSGSMTDCLSRVTETVTSPYGLPLQTIRRAYAGATNSDAVTNSIIYLSGMTTPDQEAEDYPVALTDEGGRTRQYEYTELGQLRRATDLSGVIWWTNQFDPNTGALTNVLSPTGETNFYIHDELDNVKAIGFADGNWLTNFYNEQNRLSGARLPSGTLLTKFYDFASRLTNRQAKVNGVLTESAVFEYNGNDAVTVMTDNTGGTTNLYDAAGRLWGIDYPSGASVRYELDLLGRITGLTNKTSTGGTAYVTRYEYDPVGNISKVIDPFNGNTSFEYDRVGRRTKRTLPNGIISSWEYNWKDQVTNIIHKTSGGTILASVLYERAAGGEPTKATREDGTYVVLGYDAALRLTNEIYYSSGGVAQTTNSYGYDASGSRIRLVKGGTVLTNAVSAGYRVTEIKNGSGTVETYGYDNGGRVTTISRDGAVLNLGYNSADQLTAVTNGATWVTYVHDAAGRRTVSTNSAGTVRRLLVAPTPGTDLESPHLIASASGIIQQGYVYLGDKPILRYTSSGTAGYFLEDGMGSMIALAPSSNPSPANTTCLFYDGFGNARATNGPAPTIPSGAAGDFRFHGAWLEGDSGLYNVRAREYDPRMGRFTSRDPSGGDSKFPETLNPYAFANDNPCLYGDSSGLFSMPEISISTLIQEFLAGMKTAAINYAKTWAKQKVQSFFVQQFTDLIRAYLPFDFDPRKYIKGGIAFEALVKDVLCTADFGWFHFEAGVEQSSGRPVDNGINCYQGKAELPHPREGIRRPDVIIGPRDPVAADHTANKEWLIIEIKLRESTLARYATPKKNGQLDAILLYAANNQFTRVAAFVALTRGNESKVLNTARPLIAREAARRGVVAVVVSLQGLKRFR